MTVHLIESPSAAVMVLLDRMIQLMCLGIIHIRIVHAHHFFGKYLLYLIIQPSACNITPLVQKSRRKRDERRRQQYNQNKSCQYRRISTLGQFRDQQSGKINSYIRSQCVPCDTNKPGYNHMRTSFINKRESPPVQLPCFTPFQQFLVLFHRHPPLCNICSEFQTAERIHRITSAIPRVYLLLQFYDCQSAKSGHKIG